MIAGVVLAAGNARRFDGTQKLLATLPYGGSTVPLVRLTVSGLVAAGVERLIVVGGRDADAVRAALDGITLHFVRNDAYAAGMSGSLRLGVSEAVSRWPEAEAVLIALGDQPLLGTGIVEALGRRFHERAAESAPPRIVAPKYKGEMGTPVLFAREVAPELTALTGDHGARGVVERDPSRVRYVDFDFAAPIDIDTVDDLAAFTVGLRK